MRPSSSNEEQKSLDRLEREPLILGRKSLVSIASSKKISNITTSMQRWKSSTQSSIGHMYEAEDSSCYNVIQKDTYLAS